jgi:hypothetical protein
MLREATVDAFIKRRKDICNNICFIKKNGGRCLNASTALKNLHFTANNHIF